MSMSMYVCMDLCKRGIESQVETLEYVQDLLRDRQDNMDRQQHQVQDRHRQ